MDTPRLPIDYGFADSEPSTLNELLIRRARQNPDDTYVTFLADARAEEHRLTFGKLAERSRHIATALFRHGLEPGNRILLILPTGLPFIEMFFGILAAGMVPVPAYPPARLARLEHYLRTLGGIVETGGCKAGIIDHRLIPLLAPRLPQNDVLLLSEHDLDATEQEADICSLDPSSPAFLQFTSGTTSRPRGVLLHQTHVMAQLRSYAETVEQAPGKVAVSWLPLYHDLGLIGKVLACLYSRMHLVLLSPVDFLKDPECWLRAISNYRGTHTVGPNFAYGLCVRKCSAESLRSSSIDLSSLEVMGLGGELVSMQTIEDFRAHFQPFGLNPEILCPCYGLAENTLGATAHRAGESTRSLSISRTALQKNRVREPVDSKDAHCLPSNGRAMPSMTISIIDKETSDPKTAADLDEREIGEIWIQSPSLAAGYFNDGEASRATFVTRRDRRRWLRTGDLGFLDHGDLYICGRLKDMMIVRGRNYYPQDLEELIGGLEGVRTGNVAAFAVGTAEEGERAIVVCEIDPRVDRPRDQLSSEIAAESSSAFDLVLSDIVLVQPGTVPKTSSGKLQRSLLRRAYEDGEIATFEPPGTVAQVAIWVRTKLNSFTRRRPPRTTVSEQPTSVGSAEEQLVDLDSRLIEALYRSAPELAIEPTPRLRLDAIGLDSMARMELWLALESLYRARIPEEAWSASRTLGDVQRLAEQYANSGSEQPTRTVSDQTPLLVRALQDIPPFQPGPQPPRAASLAFGFVSALSRWLWQLEVRGHSQTGFGAATPQGTILAGNHVSYLDGAWIRQALDKSERHRLLAMSWGQLGERSQTLARLASLVETISIDPEAGFIGAMRSGLSALQEGRILLIFPEGQRSHTGLLETFRPGVGLLSILSGRPVVPFRIDGGFEIYPRHRSLPRFFRNRGEHLQVHFGTPIQPPRHDRERSWEQARALVASLRKAITEL